MKYLIFLAAIVIGSFDFVMGHRGSERGDAIPSVTEGAPEEYAVYSALLRSH